HPCADGNSPAASWRYRGAVLHRTGAPVALGCAPGECLMSMSVPQPDPAKLQRLIDIQEMRDALTRYCRGTDRADYELATSAFWPDSTEDHGPYQGTSHDFIRGIMPILKEQYEQLFREVTHFTVDIKGDLAESESYWFAILRDATLDLFQAGRYLDRWERRNG